MGTVKQISISFLFSINYEIIRFNELPSVIRSNNADIE